MELLAASMFSSLYGIIWYHKTNPQGKGFQIGSSSRSPGTYVRCAQCLQQEEIIFHLWTESVGEARAIAVASNNSEPLGQP